MSDDNSIKKSGTLTEYTAHQQQEVLRCMMDPEYFIETYVMIQHPMKGAVPFKPFEYQRRMIKAFHENRNVAALCGRQLGKTTTAGAYLLWKAIFTPDSTIVIVANIAAAAQEILDRVQFSYENLPDFIRCGAPIYNKRSLAFDNGSRILCRSAQNGARGLSVTLLVVDEMAFIAPNIANAFWKAVQPTLGCLAGDTLVLSDNGFDKIVNYHKDKEVGDYFPINGNIFGKNGLEPLSYGYVSPESETLIITTRKGLQVETTLAHPLYALRELKGIMVPAIELLSGDQLRIQVGMNIYGKMQALESDSVPFLEEDLAYQIGGWIAEGWISRENQIEISNTEDDFRNRYINSKYLKAFRPLKSNPSRLMCCSKELVQIYKDIGINPLWKCYNKEVPIKVLQSPQSVQASFLQGLFDGDGSVSYKTVVLSSSSRLLLSQVQQILFNMGIISSVSLTMTGEQGIEKNKNRLMPQGKKIKSHRDQYSLNINKSGLKLFYEKIGFGITRKMIKLSSVVENTVQGNDKIMCVPKTIELTQFIKQLFDESGKTKLWFRSNGCRLEKAMHMNTKKGTITHKFLHKFLSLLTNISSDAQLVFDELLGDFIWDDIVSITESNNRTYDFTVPETHSFIQNGLLGSNTGGSCIITSTPKSDTDQFAQIWRQANDNTDANGNPLPHGRGVNGFFPFKAIWSDHPERDESWAAPYRESLGMAGFLQEMECEFVNDDETLINPLTLSYMHGQKPAFFVDESRWYVDPIPNQTYLVGLDPALGTLNDAAAIQIFMVPGMVQVAEWQSNSANPREQMRTFLKLLWFLDEELRNHPDQIGEPQIYWTVENNSLGEANLQTIEDVGEQNFPGSIVNERRRKGVSKRFRKGLNTNTQTKKSACAQFKNLVESGRITVSSENLVSEMKNYVRSGNSFKAKAGLHDDLVACTLLCVRMAAAIKAQGVDVGDDLSNTFTEDEIFGEPMPMIM